MSSEGERSEPGHSVPRAGGRRPAPDSPRDPSSSPAPRSDVVAYSSRNQAPTPYGQRPASSRQPLQPERSREGTLTHVIETLLDKGLVINADITVSLAGVELLGIRIRAALASFDTAARYGLDFPSGTNRNTAAWNDAMERKETCPQCGKPAPVDQLLYEFCPWCGWKSAIAIRGSGPNGESSGGEESDGDENDGGQSDDGESRGGESDGGRGDSEHEASSEGEG